MNFRRFFALVVLACWIAATLITAGGWIADRYATNITVREAVFNAKPASNNAAQLQAESEAVKAVIDFQTDDALGGKWEFRIWVGLTLLGAALFAERERLERPLPDRGAHF